MESTDVTKAAISAVEDFNAVIVVGAPMATKTLFASITAKFTESTPAIPCANPAPKTLAMAATEDIAEFEITFEL